MKNILFISLLLLITSLFIGCGSSNNKESAINNEATESNIILKKGDSIVCTTATPFSVEPTNKPLVNFSKNIENGEVTITLNKKSKGFVTVIGCTRK